MTGSVPRRHDVLIQHDVEARMRDGVVLRANVYRPADDGRYPVLLSRQPYNKDVNINLMYADPVFLAARGYIVVMQDVRGRYASDGEFAPSDQEFDDGYDTVQWAAGLPGSDGQVGMFGRSYHAETQWRAAVMEPPALKSMIAGVSRFHHVTEAQERPGGANEGSRLGWLQFQIGADLLLRRHRTEPQELACAMAEFGATTARLASGELLDLLPLRQLADLPGSLMAPVIAAMGGPLDTPLYRRPWPDNTYERVHADTFHIGGWYDIFTPGTLEPVRGDARRSRAPWPPPAPSARRPLDAQLLPRQHRTTRLRPQRLRGDPRRPRWSQRRASALVRRHPQGRRRRDRRDGARAAVRDG